MAGTRHDQLSQGPQRPSVSSYLTEAEFRRMAYSFLSLSQGSPNHMMALWFSTCASFCLHCCLLLVYPAIKFWGFSGLHSRSLLFSRSSPR